MDQTNPNYKFLSNLDQILKNVQFGPIDLSVQVHSGRAVSLYGKAFIHKTYKHDGGIEALEEFLTNYKLARDENKTGTVTVTFEMKKGEVKEMVVHAEYVYPLEGGGL